MPSISQTTISPINGKKRRRDNEIGPQVVRISSPRHVLHNTLFSNAANRDDSLHPHPERKQIAPRRALHSQKRQRIDIPSLHAGLAKIDDMNGTATAGSIWGGGETLHLKPALDLSPCHVCWRKPTEKAELDCYAYCEGCGERACYVCMRECEGLRPGSVDVGGRFSFELDVGGDGQDWELCMGDGGREGNDGTWDTDRIGGHRGRICSRCCVERGVDGEVCCLGCLRAVEAVS